MMKKWLLGALLTAVLCAAALGAFASGATLKIYTPFAEQDAAAQAYNDLIEQWSAETENMIEDYSGVEDEQFLTSLTAALEAGEVDIVILPVGSGIDSKYLLDVQTLLSIAPDCGARSMSGMQESDGQIILSPIRFNWESLYFNKSVFEQCGLSVPNTFEELIISCLQLSQMGVQPIANALCEWPEIVLDCMAMMGAPETAYGTQESLDGASNVLSSLVLVGGFGADPWNATDVEMEQLFLSGAAAMRFDTSDLASRIPEELADSITVGLLPGIDGNVRTSLVGLPNCGLAITRACSLDANRRDAAISLASVLMQAKLAGESTGALNDSIAGMSLSAQNISGVLFDYFPDTFEDWSEQAVAALMSITAGAQE